MEKNWSDLKRKKFERNFRKKEKSCKKFQRKKKVERNFNLFAQKIV